MSSANSKLIYANQFGDKPGQDRAAVLRNSQAKEREAFGTIPHDNRAPAVVEKADADLAQQRKEMGDGDDASNAAPADEAGQAADQPAAEGGVRGSGGDADLPAADSADAGEEAKPSLIDRVLNRKPKRKKKAAK